MCAVGSNPEEAIVRAVNDTLDNDTVAAIVRAAVGALHGRASLPRRSMDIVDWCVGFCLAKALAHGRV